MTPRSFLPALSALVLCLSLTASAPRAFAQTQAVPNRIVSPIDEAQQVTLRGNTHPMARTEFDRGIVSSSMPMERMMLLLSRSAAQQDALDRLVADQYNPSSPSFHHWLTADEFGKAFGPSDGDIKAVTAWLTSHGFSIGNVSKGRVTIEFTGTAGQVQEALHTEIHHYLVNGEMHTANASDPQIPAALAGVVGGVASLHDFHSKPQHIQGAMMHRDAASGQIRPAPVAGASAPQYASIDKNSTQHEYISPYDFATIYDLGPLWTSGYNGAGQSIAIVGRSDVTIADIAYFQAIFGLANNVPTIVHNGPPAGLTSDGDLAENTLDLEWSGATAPGANITLVVSKSTGTSDGALLSTQYIIDNQVAKVMNSSYGNCELNFGTAGNNLYNSLYQQAASEGISAFASAGDQGSAGCDGGTTSSPYEAKFGLAVNGIASTPYITAVGGTDLSWQSGSAGYWNPANAADGSSARSYIPEMTWNTSCTNSLFDTVIGQTFQPPVSLTTPEATCNAAYPTPNNFIVQVAGGGGGVSACTTPTGMSPATCAGGYAKPSWQTGAGVPADGKRDVPDVSLFASPGFPDPIPSSAYLFCYSTQATATAPAVACSTATGALYLVGGTSVSSPAMAGIMALINQKVGSTQGLANPVLYELAASSPNAFHDVSSGTIAQPCQTGTLNCTTTKAGDAVGVMSGYAAGIGYDLATGLGSIDAFNLATAWKAQATGTLLNSTAGLTLSATSVTPTTPVTFTGTVTGQTGSPTPTGAVKFYNGYTLLGSGTLNGSGVATYTSTESAGTYAVTASYLGDTVYNGSVSAPQFLSVVSSVVPTATTTGIAGTVNVVSPATDTFTSTVSGTSGTPTGTITFKDGTTVLGSAVTLVGGSATSAPATLAIGTHSITAVYSGDSSNLPSTSPSLMVTVAAPLPDFTLSLSPANVSVSGGTAATTTVSIAPLNGFNTATTFVCSGLPTSSVCTFSPATVTPNGSATATTALSISTVALAELALPRFGGWGLVGGGGAVFAMLFWPGLMTRRRRARWLRVLGIAVVCLAGMQAVTGCGGSKSSAPSGPQPVVSNVTVTATSGSIVHTATLTLTVN